MSGQVDLGAIANEYIRGNAEQRRELQWQYPTQFADAAFRACIEAMAAQQTPHSNSRPPSTRPPSTTRQRIPPTERASRKTPTPKPRTSSRAGRGTPSSAATPYFSVMKTLCKGLPRAAKKMEKLQSDRQKQREKMMKEFLTKFYKGNKRLIAAARGVDLAQPQSERKSTTSTAPQHLVTVLGRIDAEMERIGVQLERGDQGDVQEEGCDGPTPDSQPTGGEAEQPKILHRCLENAQLYYDRVHRDKTDIFPTFPSEVFEDGKALLDFQWEGVRWMGSLHLNGLNGILADDMGLGKTIQIISFFNCLKYYANVAGPHLVLAPLSVLVNWRSEFTAWAPNQFRAYTITEIVSQGIAIKDVDVVICNYDFLTSGSTGARATTYRSLMRQSFVYIVADEGHRLKNKKAQTFEKVCKVKCQHRLILTGTPLQNNFLELFTLLHFVMPNVFGEHFGHDSLQRLLSNFLNSDVGEEYAEVLLSRLHQLLRPFILRRAAGEVAPELVPDLDECVISCPLSTLRKSRTYFGRVSMYPDDVASLQPGHWLRDMAITFYCAHLENIITTEHPDLAPSVAFLDASMVFALDFMSTEDCATQLASFRLPEAQLVMMPINDASDPDLVGAGTHWGLLCFERDAASATSSWTMFDSSGSSLRPVAEKVARKLSPLVGCAATATAAVDLGKGIMQTNSYDCGVCVCLNAVRVLAKHIPTLRRNVLGLETADTTEFRTGVLNLLCEE
eukprot:PhM_4_TR10912/c0_g1_i3/m.5226/K11654/SMARCA5, SNF2H, ISWI; SWI/SNF-related matrix-associated actin-dependent regulator of chromatin subfamily A member 5